MSAEQHHMRTAIAVSKDLDPGAVANSAAIVMGQLALSVDALYSVSGVRGSGGIRHAAIRNNVVILTGRQGRIDNLLDAAVLSDQVTHVAFSDVGRRLSNSFVEYEKVLTATPLGDIVVLAVGIAGPDAAVRNLTRKLSYYTG